jgi:hypothetical protein
MRRPVVALVALAAAGAIAAGCSSNNPSSGSSGSSGGGAYGSTGTTSAGTGQSSVATVKTASSKVGTILVDANGRTLYLFEKDQPNKSECAGACASDWPPSGGVERPHRKERFARLIQRRVRAFWPAFGRRRLRR